MNKRGIFILLITFTVVSFLTGCAGENAERSAPTPSQAILSSTLSPTLTATSLPTITPTADYYTQEERMADGKTWYAKDFVLAIYGDNGKGDCIVPQVNLDKFNKTSFALPNPGEEMNFAQQSHYVRISPNVWSIPSHNESFGFTSSDTLAIGKSNITQTTEMVSPTGETTTCVNIWTPVE